MANECTWCEKKEGFDMADEPLELISEITEFVEIHDFISDKEFDRAMELIVKFVVRQGDVEHQNVAPLIVELSALAAKFALLSTYYNGIGKAGQKESHKKNMYYTMREALNKLCDSLKYMAKV